MIEHTSNNIMIDPSLVVAGRTIKKTFTLIREFHDRGFRFYFPKSFQSLLYVSESYEESPLFGFFLQGAKSSDFGKLSRLMKDYSEIIGQFEVSPEKKEEYRGFYESLSGERRFRGKHLDKHILDVLFEEWIFLNGRSWIVSRIKRPFNQFTHAGAVCLEFGRRTLEEMVRKTLKKKEGDIISKADALRAFGKWIAVGGSSILRFFDPVVSILGVPAAGFFLLFDPGTTADNSRRTARLSSSQIPPLERNFRYG